MKTTYLVWEDPTCDGINPNWPELTRLEFLTLVRSAEAAGRYFVKLENAQDGTVTVIEATRASYLVWKQEKNHSDYLRICAEGKPTVSYHALRSDGRSYGEESLEDKSANVLTECLEIMTRETLNAALASLTAEESRIIAYLYLSDRRGTERGYANLTRSTNITVHRKKVAALNKLKKIFENA